MLIKLTPDDDTGGLLVGERMHVHVGVTHLLDQVPRFGSGNRQNGVHRGDILDLIKCQ